MYICLFIHVYNTIMSKVNYYTFVNFTSILL